MVSVKSAAPLVLVLLAGCAGVMPIRESAPEPAEPRSQPVQRATAGETGAGERYLPAQAYNELGEAIPYTAAPNPYLDQPALVDEAARVSFLKARALLEQGELRQARRVFREMTRVYPELSGPWLQLAAIAEQREQPEQARKAYQKAVEVNPANVNAYLSHALFERHQGEFEQSRSVYLAALSVWRDFPEAHLNLGILYDLYMNRPEQAQPHYEAYDFLTGGTDPKVADWMIEIRRRTGIETSFIDNPPPAPDPETEAETGTDADAEVSAGPGQSVAPAETDQG